MYFEYNYLETTVTFSQLIKQSDEHFEYSTLSCVYVITHVLMTNWTISANKRGNLI